MKYRRLLILIGVVIIICLAVYLPGRIVSREYSIANRTDGGYLINVVIYKRHLITADGIFLKERRTYTIELTGQGTDWEYRNQKGYYYSLDEIKSIQKEWDFGYTWISDDRKYVYLNLFWVNAPDNVTPSDVNGRYEIQNKKRGDRLLK